MVDLPASNGAIAQRDAASTDSPAHRSLGRDAHETLGRALSESAEHLVALVAPAGVVEYVNETAARVLGRAAAEVEGATLATLFGDAVGALMVRGVEHVLATGSTVRSVGPMPAAGTNMWLDSTLRPLGAGGSHPLVLVISTDVTARMMAEELHAAILQTSIDGVLIVDEASRIVDVNTTYGAMSGYLREELVGQPLVLDGDAQTPLSPPTGWAALCAERFEASHRRRDGSTFVVEVSRQSLAHTGRHVYFVHDVSEHRRAVSELQTSNRKLEAAHRYWQQTFDSMADAVTIQDANHRVLHANRAALAMLGGDEASIVGARCAALFHGRAEGQPAECPGASALESGCNNSWRTFEPRLGRWLDVSCSPLQGGEGRRELVHVVRDITENRRLEEQFQASQRMEAVARLTAGVAHDFNNLLGVILGAASVEPETLAEQREATSTIMHAARRAAELTRQLLAFSRRQVFRIECVDVRDVVRDVERLVSRVVGAHITVQSDLTSDVCTVMADRAQLEQVIMNLALNARDAMPERGELVLSVRRGRAAPEARADLGERSGGEFVVATVTDTGTGMDAETLARAFEPFFTTKAPGQGTGLGLAAVHGVVHQHGGAVTAWSALREGTRMSVHLPFAEVAAVEAAPALPRVAALPSRRRVLVVDDDPAMRRVAARILARAGWEPALAADGATALQLAHAAERPFDVLLTDLCLPDMSGLELGVALRAAHSELRIAITSGYADRPPDWSRLAAAPTAFVPKPWTAQELVAAMSALYAVAADP